MTAIGVGRRFRCGVGLGFRTRVNLKHYRDDTRPAHQYPFRVGQVRKAFRHNANHVAMYRFPRPVKRGWAVSPIVGHALDIRVSMSARAASPWVSDMPHRDTAHVRQV